MDSRDSHSGNKSGHRPSRWDRLKVRWKKHPSRSHKSSADVLFSKFPVLDVGITCGARATFLDEFARLSDHRTSAFVCFVNVHMLMEASQDLQFQAIVNAADIACPDGLPVAHSIGWIYAMRQSQIAGPDTLPALLEIAHLMDKKIFVLGTTPDVLAAFKRRAEADYGEGIVVGTNSPPFRMLTQDEDDELVRQINDSGADMIFVALGCPKQERWMHAHRGKVNGCMFGLGYAIPVFAGIESRAPRWMVERGLEWLFRLSANPRRLLKRYVRTNSSFLLQIAKATVWHRAALDRGET